MTRKTLNENSKSESDIIGGYPEASEYTRLKISRLRYLVHKKQIPHLKVNHLVRFRRSDLDAWLEQFLRPQLSESKQLQRKVREITKNL